MLVPGDAGGVGDIAAEEVEGGADGEVDAALAEAVGVFEGVEGGGSAGVGDREGAFGSQKAYEVVVHAAA